MASVSRVTAAQLAAIPQTTLGDALRQVPGFALVDFTGDGYGPQVMVRGFYGGGEAEYVVVLMNGKPLNDLQSGLVRWDAIPLAAIESIEIVRGGTSALYGDAAVGAVINVITRAPGSVTVPVASIATGSHGTVRSSAYAGGTLLNRGVSAYGSFDRSDGYREHAERNISNLGAEFRLVDEAYGHLTLSGAGQWREVEEPGPLLESDLAADRRASDPFHRFDRTDERSGRISLDGERRFGVASRIVASLSGESRSTDAIRTISLSPQFADTKERDLETRRGSGSLQLSLDGAAVPNDRLTIGADASYGTIDSKYYQVLLGPRAVYRLAAGERGALDASGTGDRKAAAAFAQYILVPMNALRLSAGIRGDWFSDSFEPSAQPRVTAEHTAWSPQAGINLRWLSTGTQMGNVYLTGGRSFKAPTLDQLFDQRSLPFAPGFNITTSNAQLEPQEGINLEGGIYHTIVLVPGSWTGDLSIAAYRMDMKNELDFDVAQLKYVNIGRSRHQGLEAAARVNGPWESSVFVNYTAQRATYRSGDNFDNFIRAIPRQVATAGFEISPISYLQTGVQLNHNRGIYLDDANTIEHPAYTRVDGRAALRLPQSLGGIGIFMDVRNLFGSTYSTTGYPDPSGSGALYFYPAAGRTIDVGIRVGN